MGSRGAIIMGFFGAVFIAMTLHWQWHVSGMPLALPFAVFVMIGLGALRVMRLPGEGITPSPRAEKAITWASVGEGIGLFLASNLVMNLHHPEWLMPAVALVVGLHFLPIAWAAPFPPFYALGSALIAAAVVGVLLPAPLGGALSGFAAALALWTASLVALLRDAGAKRAALS
ncbi:hypothetical protein [Novosphingobium sp.]|uniref:hypothetical protein n=1 Tax=Novosphingobium sp. TaxID=1874826 RepID=UPI0031DEF33E